MVSKPQSGRDPGGGGGMYVQISTTSNTKISDINAIIIERWLQENFCGYSDCRRSRDGSLILLTRTKKQADVGVFIKEIQVGPENRIPVIIKKVDNLNTCKGTIFGSDLLKIPLEGECGLLACLNEQNIVNVERIKTRDRTGRLDDFGLHVLTFNNRQQPEEVKVGYLKYSVKKWYPSPLKCQKCLSFGHTKNRCEKDVQLCKKCSKEAHDGNCTMKCIHCDAPKDAHSAFSRDCPVMRHEIEVCRVKEDQNISFKAAREQLAPQIGRNYADALKGGHSDINAVLCDSDELQQKIEKYQAAVAELEKKKKVLAGLIQHYERLSGEVANLSAEVDSLHSKTPSTQKKPKEGPIASRLRHSVDGTKTKPLTPPVAKKRQKISTSPTAEHHDALTDQDGTMNDNEIELIEKTDSSEPDEADFSNP